MRKKIKDMTPGLKFLVGSTPAMKINTEYGEGGEENRLWIDFKTAHVSLLTGYVNFVADVSPEDEFKVI